MRVLVVDSSAAIGVRLAARLREEGLEVVGMAGTAEAALAHAVALAPDAIVLDPHLPDRVDPGLLPELKQRAPRALVVVLASDGNSRYRRHCEAHGADYFFDKASEFDALAGALAGAAARLSDRNRG